MLLHGHAVDQATVRERKTGEPARFELTEQTWQAVGDYKRTTGWKQANFDGA